MPTPVDPPTPTGITAAARIVAAPNGRGGTALPTLHGDGPFALHRSRNTTDHAEVTIIGAMSAPLGGDHLTLDVTVKAGAHLRIGTATATVALPSRRRDQATYHVHLTADENTVLHWLPEPLISTAHSDLITTIRIRLARGARLLLRERQILGRTGEQPGHLVSKLTLHYDDHPLLHQELTVGPDGPGWSGPAILGDHRALGQLLIVDPTFRDNPPTVRLLPDTPADAQAVLTPLAGPAILITALAPDALRVQNLLDLSLASSPEWARTDSYTPPRP
ncbi:MAG: urease accessory protein UreD [Actinomycetota bacterium]|nr:urease accessory protein UreD [Actinomycetota bacterium]